MREIIKKLVPGRAYRFLKGEQAVRIIKHSGLFDCSYYRSQGSKHSGNLPEELIRHYLKAPSSQGLNPHPLFDSNYYLSNYEDVRLSGMNPFIHYLMKGWKEGRQPHPEFDPPFYYAEYPRIRSIGLDPLIHYLRCGAGDGLNPSRGFNTRWYEARHREELLGMNPLVHYVLYGRDKGYSPGPMSREGKILSEIDRDGNGLEVGPSYNPIAPKKQGFNVKVLDHACADELRKKYKGIPHVNIDNIEEVDFVWSGQSYLEIIGETECYDWIIASHVIEHIPNMILFFQECEALLKPNGILSLAIPDKRYCFDYYLPVSTTGNLLDAWTEKRTRPTAGQAFDYTADNAKCDGKTSSRHESEVAGMISLCNEFSSAKDLWRRASSSNEYIDVHCWRFTPASFRLILMDLKELGLINLNMKSEFDTSGIEFFVSLCKDADKRIHRDRLQELWKRMMENK